MLKRPQAQGDQLEVLSLLVAENATASERATRAPMMAGGNLLNRMFARGWLTRPARASGGSRRRV